MKLQGSWKTTLSAILGLVAVLALQFGNLLDEDPTTLFDWSVIGTHLPLIFIGLFARDNNKSSQDVGIRQEEKKTVAPPPNNANYSRGRGY